jgi:transglutaminase-like putative cysteine protease
MEYRVTHTTTYAYSQPVSLCHNLAHLTPRDVPYQRCALTSLSIVPQPAVVRRHLDYFGNEAVFFTIQEPHRQLVVEASHVLRLAPRQPPSATDSVPWEEVRDQLPADRSAAALEAYQFVFGCACVQTSPRLAEYAASSFPPGRPFLEAVLDLSRRIHQDFVYDPRATTVATPVAEVFDHRRGVCQDFAHLQIACLRSLGLPARYVSGYLCTTSSGKQPRLVGADATHAWVSVYCPRLSWVDVDPTNNQVPTDKHLLLAWGRDYDDVSPIKGVMLGGSQHGVQVEVTVVPTEGPGHNS